ncbi:MAG: sodium/solute symporter [Myxococcota bacterium]
MDTGVALANADWIAIVVYLTFIVALGLWFGRFTKSTEDFFFGGRRFSWWLVGFSCVATLVGSYSFINYSEVGFGYGLSSVTNYTNDWFVLPLFLLGWLPIIYFNRIVSIPEYFERRYGRRIRVLVLILMMVYLEGYIGINLLTIGVAMNGLFGWNVVMSAAGMAVISGLYLHAGGQTSVLMTDLVQGFLLLAAGLVVFLLGISYVGGFDNFWQSLPQVHRLPFAGFNSPPEFHFVGEFWGDAMAGTLAFYFINQGVLMRFLSARSVQEGRKAMLFVAALLMPIAAIAVGGGGWIGRALVETGVMSPEIAGRDVFIAVARIVCQPGVFGLVVAAMIAALMSTLDTLLSAVSAVAVNDVWRLVRPDQPDAYYLSAARWASALATVVGVLLIPVFQQFASIYQAMSHFTSVITPPLVVVVVLGVVWSKFTARAAALTLILGSVAMVLSLIEPAIITPIAHGVDPSQGYSYIRSFFGLLVSVFIGVVVTLFDRQGWVAAGEPGLSMATLNTAVRMFKGGEPNYEGSGNQTTLRFQVIDEVSDVVRLPSQSMQALQAKEGDLLYISDTRWWLGGFGLPM